MSTENWVTVRVWFTKTGRAKYISHLDLNRCMMRAIQKAKIPLWFTEGFNPHAFITFALPLSLGIDGLRESMDIRLVEEISKEELIEKVNAGLPEDIRIFDVTAPVMKPGKIAYASFTITIEPEDRTAEECVQIVRDLLAQDTVVVKKKSKSGIKDVDIKPFLDVKELRVDGNNVVIEILLPAGSTQNVNPQLLFAALENFCGTRFYARIVRNDLFDKDSTVFQ